MKDTAVKQEVQPTPEPMDDTPAPGTTTIPTSCAADTKSADLKASSGDSETVVPKAEAPLVPTTTIPAVTATGPPPADASSVPMSTDH